jgi:hypothetical protein
MAEENIYLLVVNRNDLIKAKKYTWIYLSLFINDDMCNNHREIMPKLNSSQQTFLTFNLLNDSMSIGSYFDYGKWGIKGGFLQLIYDGHGEYVFEKPFSKIIGTWGAKKISRIVEKAKSKYIKHKDKVKKLKTLKELSDLYSEISDFKKLDLEYLVNCGKDTEIIKEYIDTHISDFAIIDENNTQVSDIDSSIKEREEVIRIIKEYDEKNKK